VLAAVLTQINSDLELADVEPLGPNFGQVLVRMIRSGICGAQLQEISGFKNNAKFLPHLLGHEGFGIVEQIGDGVTNVKVGDNVILHWRPGLGLESDFPRYRLGKKTISSGKVTTLSQFTLASENRLSVVDRSTDPSLGAMMGCSSSTAFSILENEIELKPNDSVLIIGAGGVGLNLILGAKMLGLEQISVLESRTTKKGLCRQLGARHFYSGLECIEDKYDYILDCVGSSTILRKGLSLIKGGGTILMIAQPRPNEQLVFDDGVRIFEGSGTTIKATQGGGFVPQRDLNRYLATLGENLERAKSIVTHTYSLRDVNFAFNTLRSGEAGRIMIDCS
jgi:S-(hydroxymethyl)glutathione dehydrogenase / alcohol dehydrogenase